MLMHNCQRPKFDSALHVPKYIENLGPILEYNTSIYEGDLPVNKRIGREHSNHHVDQVSRTIITKVCLPALATPLILINSTTSSMPSKSLPSRALHAGGRVRLSCNFA